MNWRRKVRNNYYCVLASFLYVIIWYTYYTYGVYMYKNLYWLAFFMLCYTGEYNSLHTRHTTYETRADMYHTRV